MERFEKDSNPYPGLRPFEFDESHIFFGRDGQSEEMLNRLGQNRFLAVVGVSGSGKSSLVRAGLLPLLHGGFMAGAGSGWKIAVFRPGDNPIHNMAKSLSELGICEINLEGGETPRKSPGPKQDTATTRYLKMALVETILRRSALGLIDLVRHSNLQQHEKLLVVVDQFEEIFRFKEKSESPHPEDEASAFIKLILEAVQDETEQIYVILTMRSDFLGDCAQFRDLPEAINDCQYLIPRLRREQLRQAIVSPAAVFGAKIEPPLVHRLLNEVGDNPDHLPMLQHALMRTWQHWRANRRNGEMIGLSHYEGIGGITNALSQHADEAYNELPDQRSKAIAEKLFKCLTERGAGNREVRRPAKLEEIRATIDAPEADIISVIDLFREEGRSFLMPPAGVQIDSESVIDISHESLIRGWDRLKKWVEEESQSARIYKRLAESAALYSEGGERLWGDPALQLALNWKDSHNPNKVWAQRYHPGFDEAMKFLEESRINRDLELAEKVRRENERVQAEQERLEREKLLAQQNLKIAEAEREMAEQDALRAEEQRANAQKLLAEQTSYARRLNRLVIALVLLFVAAAVSAVVAFYKTAQANTARDNLIRADAQLKDANASLTELESAKTSTEKELKAKTTDLEAKTAELTFKLQDLAAIKTQTEDAINAMLEAQQSKQKAIEEAAKIREAALRDSMSVEGLDFLRQGNLREAEKKFLALLSRYSDDKDGKARQAWTRYNLGAVYQRSGRYDEATSTYEAALENQKDAFGNLSRGEIGILSNLIEVHRQELDDLRLTGKFYYLIQLLEHLAQTEKDDQLALYLANTYNEQATFYRVLGASHRGTELYTKALEIWKDKLKADPFTLEKKYKYMLNVLEVDKGVTETEQITNSLAEIKSFLDEKGITTVETARPRRSSRPTFGPG